MDKFLEALVDCKNEAEVRRLSGQQYPPIKGSVLIVPRITAMGNKRQRAIVGVWDYYGDSTWPTNVCEAQVFHRGSEGALWLDADGNYVEFTITRR